MPNLRILRRKLTELACILFIPALIQCSSLLQIEKLKKCEFRLERIENLSVDGIDMNRVRSINDLGIINTTNILHDLTKGSLSSEFIIIISVNNPNNSAAAMDKFDYVVLLDDNEVINGSLNKGIEVPANKSIEFPLSATVNLSKLIKDNSISALMELVNSLFKKNTIEKRVRIKVKPYIRIGKKSLKYPGFFEIKINEWSK